MLRRLSNDVKPSETGSDHTYIQPLIAASTECVEACGTLQRVAPVLPLSSPFARDLHTLFYVVSNVETQLHHFIERELLQVRAGDPRSREHGARLQDALERAASSSTVGLNFRMASAGSKVSAVQFCSATETGKNATRRGCVSVAFVHRAVKPLSVEFRQELAADAAVQERYSSMLVATVSTARREDSEEQFAASTAAPAADCRRRRLELPNR